MKRLKLICLVGIVVTPIIFLIWPSWTDGAIDKMMRRPLAPGETLINREDTLEWSALRGDSYGSFTALVTMLAFLGVLWGIWRQEDIIAASRQEAKDARRQVEDQMDIQDEMAKAARQAAKLNAIRARIEGYTDQLETLEAKLAQLGVPQNPRSRELQDSLRWQRDTCEAERRNLLIYLDKALLEVGVDKTKDPNAPSGTVS